MGFVMSCIERDDNKETRSVANAGANDSNGQAADGQPDQVTNIKEWLAIRRIKNENVRRRKMLALFKQIDKDKNGSIDLKELTEFVRSLNGVTQAERQDSSI
jgi:hypothetical protein